MAKDMTAGNPTKLLLLFTLPVLFGNLFQNLYSIIDTVIVGQYLGVDALAAVGSTGSLTFITIGLVTGTTSGFGILISQAFGARDEKHLRHYTAMSLYLCVAFSIIFTVLFLLLNKTILTWMNTPDTIFSNTYIYIGIIYLGFPVSIFYNMLAAIARALGDSRTPLYFLIISSVLNIVLDFLFVAILPFGVGGAAAATVIAQGISAILCCVYTWKKYPQIHFHKEDAQINWHSITSLLSMGIPMALQFSITGIGTVIVQSALNMFGATYIAAYSTSMKIQSFAIQFYPSLGVACATYSGQNYGAGRLDRVRLGVRKSMICSAVFSAFLMVLAHFFFASLLSLFVADPTGELRQISYQFFHVNLWFYPLLGIIFIYRNTLQGIGNGLVPMLGGVAELIARALVIFILAAPLGFFGILLADPVAWFSALIPLLPYYYWYMAKQKKKERLKQGASEIV